MTTECDKLAEQLAEAVAAGDEEKAAGIRKAMEAAGCEVTAEDEGGGVGNGPPK